MVLELAVLIGLAAYRCARLIAVDAILAGPRHRFYRRFPPNTLYARHYRLAGPKKRRRRRKGTWQIADQPRRKTSWFGLLVDCPYCSSVWFAAAITAAATRYTSVPLPALVWGAACSVAVICAKIETIT